MRSSLLVVLLPLVVTACSGAAEQTPPRAAPVQTAVPASPPAAAGSPSGAPTEDPIADTASPPRRARPQFRFWSFDGPADGPAITGKRAWTAIADGAAEDRWRHVFISVESFVKTDGKNNSFTAPFGDVVSPVGLAANLAPPAALKKGDPVLAENGNSSAPARVVSIDGETVTMSYVFGELTGELEAPRSELLLLDGTLKMGAPVAFKADGKWTAGQLLAKTAQDAWVALHWVDNSPYVKTKAADVQPIDVTRLLKVGDKCLSLGPMNKNELVPGKVTKVLDDGVFYEVKLDSGQTYRVPFHQVSPPLK
jgi:hypothetical protein